MGSGTQNLKGLLGLGLLLGGIAPAVPAFAFSDPSAYPDSVDLGGGGGRWFTGSPADGYGCDVCHTGGEPAQLAVQGLPLEGFAPGSSYEVTLAWPPTLKDLALIAEFSDELRLGAGTLALPRPDTLKPGELCSAEEGGGQPSAVHGFEPGLRQLVSIVDCGAQYLRFQWTAPTIVTSRIWFNAGFVSSNADALPGGDGVTMVRQPLTVAGTSLGTRTVTEGCSVRSPRAGGSWLMAVALALGVGCALRRIASNGRCRDGS